VTGWLEDRRISAGGSVSSWSLQYANGPQGKTGPARALDISDQRTETILSIFMGLHLVKNPDRFAYQAVLETQPSFCGNSLISSRLLRRVVRPSPGMGIADHQVLAVCGD